MSLFSDKEIKKNIKKEFKKFLNASALPALILDEQAHLLAYNQPASDAFKSLSLKISGKFATSKLEKMLTSIDDKPYSKKKLSYFSKIFQKTKFVKKHQIELLHKHSKYTYNLNVGILPSSGKTATLLLIIFQDITDDLRRKNLQKTFIRIVGHELKQPLGLITAHTYYLKKSFNPTKNAEEIDRIEKIEDQVNVIAQTFNDIVDATRFSLQSFSINVEPTNVLELLVKSVEELKVSNPNREINLDHSNHVMANCLIDPLRTQQVFTNILINAIKYSEDKTPIEIKVSLKAKKFIVSFTDHGSGIDKDEMDSIFEPYFRSEASDKRKVKGLGLGLSLVKNIMIRQGGSVTVKSQLNHGSTFTLSFPAAT